MGTRKIWQFSSNKLAGMPYTCPFSRMALDSSSANFSSTVAVIHSLAWWAAVKSTVRPPLPMAMASISRPKAVVPMLRLLHTG